jgi:hypothetical protein
MPLIFIDILYSRHYPSNFFDLWFRLIIRATSSIYGFDPLLRNGIFLAGGPDLEELFNGIFLAGGKLDHIWTTSEEDAKQKQWSEAIDEN